MKFSKNRAQEASLTIVPAAFILALMNVCLLALRLRLLLLPFNAVALLLLAFVFAAQRKEAQQEITLREDSFCFRNARFGFVFADVEIPYAQVRAIRCKRYGLFGRALTLERSEGWKLKVLVTDRFVEYKRLWQELTDRVAAAAPDAEIDN